MQKINNKTTETVILFNGWPASDSMNGGIVVSFERGPIIQTIINGELTEIDLFVGKKMSDDRSWNEFAVGYVNMTTSTCHFWSLHDEGKRYDSAEGRCFLEAKTILAKVKTIEPETIFWCYCVAQGTMRFNEETGVFLRKKGMKGDEWIDARQFYDRAHWPEPVESVDSGRDQY